MAINPNAPYEVLAQLKAEGKTPANILHNVNNFIEAMWNRTTTNLAAQEKRAEMTHHIRAGGAPGTKAEAQGIIRELTGIYSQVARSNLWDMATARKKINELTAAMQEANSKIAGKLAILFKSGGPFLYPNSTPSDYAAIVASGSKGKWVWQRGWGPDHHPAYVKITVTPERTIACQAVVSSWVVMYYLISQ